MMNEEEIRAVVLEVLSGLGIEKPESKDKGRIMKELMPKVKGRLTESRSTKSLLP